MKKKKGLDFQNFKLNKKGNVLVEVLIILVVLFILGIVALVMNKTQIDLNVDVQNDTSLSNESRALMQTNTDQMPILFDNIFIFILVGCWILALVAAALTDSNYIFLAIMILALVIVLIVGGILANSYEEFRSDSDISTVAALYPKINFIFEHIGIVITIMGGTILLALFAKRQF